MSAASPMVVLLLLVAVAVGVLGVLIALGRFGEGLELPERAPRGRRRRAQTESADADSGPRAETPISPPPRT